MKIHGIETEEIVRIVREAINANEFTTPEAEEVEAAADEIGLAERVYVPEVSGFVGLVGGGKPMAVVDANGAVVVRLGETTVDASEFESVMDIVRFARGWRSVRVRVSTEIEREYLNERIAQIRRLNDILESIRVIVEDSAPGIPESMVNTGMYSYCHIDGISIRSAQTDVGGIFLLEAFDPDGEDWCYSIGYTLVEFDPSLRSNEQKAREVLIEMMVEEGFFSREKAASLINRISVR